MTKQRFIENAYLLSNESYWKKFVSAHKFTEEELDKLFAKIPTKEKYRQEEEKNVIRKM